MTKVSHLDVFLSQCLSLTCGTQTTGEIQAKAPARCSWGTMASSLLTASFGQRWTCGRAWICTLNPSKCSGTAGGMKEEEPKSGSLHMSLLIYALYRLVLDCSQSDLLFLWNCCGDPGKKQYLTFSYFSAFLEFAIRNWMVFKIKEVVKPVYIWIISI